ncbi:MAG: DUF499 domain-containing protein [Armatimonadota bacterium]|nr:DUF499 domain-containing protein [Armatimonadota bacterium]
MKSIYQACEPRPEVLQGDLDDAIFGADFGHVIEGRAPKVYGDPDTFLRNTHPAAHLKKLTTMVFERLANPNESGALIRLSTGYGGGKTHTLIALWHLAHNISNPSYGTELVPAAGRPAKVAVAGVDGDKAGSDVFLRHDGIETHSLWGEIAYQLGGLENYNKVRGIDDPEKVPDAALVRDIMPKEVPVLILLDEIVLYMLKLSERGYKALLSFMNTLMSEVTGRKSAVLVVTDPGQQVATQKEARDLEEITISQEMVKALEDIMGRKMADFDPIGDESAQVIIRRLFTKVDRAAADEASAEYYKAYQRIAESRYDLLPAGVVNKEYADRIVTCYPFHPRLLDTAKDRLGAIQDFQKSRGVLRLFARILRDAWETRPDIPLITAGDINWSSPRIQADLLHRLNKDNFKAAVDADVCNHAAQLDEEYSTDIHRRVASALLLESLAPNGSMDKRDITLATLRPSEVGHEPSEALDRLMSVCWHTYKKEAGDRFYFYYEPNPNKLIEETVEHIPIEDAKQGVLALAQEYFTGSVFELVPYPSSPRSVPDTPRLKLVLSDSVELAQAICNYEDDSDPNAPRPRRFRNAILGIAPAPDEMERAIRDRRWCMAAEKVLKDYSDKKEIKKQVEAMMPNFTLSAKIAACRAFTRVVFNGRPPLTLEEKYLISEDGGLQAQKGQNNLKRFLDDNKLVYEKSDAIDTDLLIDKIIPGATPSLEHKGAYPASAVHERALASESLRLMMDGSPVQNAIINGVNEGKLVVRQPDGDVYDSAGCVTGPEGNRRRDANKRLTTLRLESDVLIAPVGAECVAEWTRTNEGEESTTKTTGNTDNTDTTDLVQTSNWEQAISYAAKRPVLKVTLKTSKPHIAKSLVALAQPFGAKSLTLTVRTIGDLKDGGSVRFVVEGAKVNSSIEPLELATKLARAVDNLDFRSEVNMDFGEQGERGKSGCFERARDEAAQDVEIYAKFGKEDKE